MAHPLGLAFESRITKASTGARVNRGHGRAQAPDQRNVRRPVLLLQITRRPQHTRCEQRAP
eukprot:365569-Chlamydomonas_euryale.AAC.17